MSAMEKVPSPSPLQQVPLSIDSRPNSFLAVPLWSLIMEKHIPGDLNYFEVAAQDDISTSGASLLALRLHCRGPEHLLFTNLWTTEAPEIKAVV